MIAKTPPRIIYLSPPRQHEAALAEVYRVGVFDATARILALLEHHRRRPFSNLTEAIMVEANILAGYEACPNN